MLSMYKDLTDVLREQRYLDAMESLAGVIKEAMEKKPSPRVGKMARDIREVMLYNGKLQGDLDDMKFTDAVRVERMKKLNEYITYLERKVKLLEEKL
jgi:polyhydroxyalkanoate synthesis regulator phasin